MPPRRWQNAASAASRLAQIRRRWCTAVLLTRWLCCAVCRPEWQVPLRSRVTGTPTQPPGRRRGSPALPSGRPARAWRRHGGCGAPRRGMHPAGSPRSPSFALRMPPPARHAARLASTSACKSQFTRGLGRWRCQTGAPPRRACYGQASQPGAHLLTAAPDPAGDSFLPPEHAAPGISVWLPSTKPHACVHAAWDPLAATLGPARIQLAPVRTRRIHMCLPSPGRSGVMQGMGPAGAGGSSGRQPAVVRACYRMTYTDTNGGPLPPVAQTVSSP